FYFEGGLQSFVRHLNRNKEALHARPIYVERREGTTLVEVALQYNETYTETLLAFANNINTADGGTHVTGFRAALTSSLNDWARKAGVLKAGDSNLSGDDVREGLTAVISVKLTDPQFEGQTKAKLGQAGPRSPLPGRAAAPRQGPQRGEGAPRQDRRQRERPPADHRPGRRDRRHRRQLRHLEAPIPPDHHHDRCRRRRGPYPDAAADLLLPAHAPGDRAGLPVHRAAAAVPRLARPGH